MALLKTEIKKTLKAVFRFLKMAVLMIALTALLAAGAFVMLDTEEDVKIRIAVTLPEIDESIGGLLITSLEGMDSVKDALEIVYADESEGEKLLKQGGVSAHIVVPDNFLNSVLSGQNVPAQVRLKNGSSIECMLIKTGFESASEILKASQSGVFAIYDAAKSGTESDKEILDDANAMFLELVFTRGTMFKVKKVSMTGNLSVTDFVVSTSLALLLALLSVSYIGMFGRENKDFYKRLSAFSVSGIELAFSKFVSCACLLLICTIPVVLTLVLTGLIYKASVAFLLIFAVFSCSAFAALLGALTENKTVAVLLGFLLAVVFLFMAGGIMPEAFLPSWVLRASNCLPIASSLTLTRSIVSYSGEYQVLKEIILTLVMLTLASVCYSFKLRRGKL